MSLEKVTKQGRLAEIFPLFDRSTIQHSDEIQVDRSLDISSNGNNAVLPKQYFWTADFPMYAMDGRKTILYMGRNKDNLIFNDIIEATKQLQEKNNYFINNTKDIASVIDSDTTLRFALSDLRLKGDNSEWKHFEINTEKYDKLNDVQRKFAERVHGKGQVFINTMEMLNNADINITNIYVLNPEYVKANIPKNGALARGSFLDDFFNYSSFGAYYGYVVNLSGRLRGVLSSSGAGAPKIVSPTYYDISQVLTDGSRESSFAPDQVKILRNIMEQNNYKIIKGE